MQAEQVRLEKEGGLAVLTLAAPGRRNALTVAMAAEIVAACEEIDGDPSIGVAVVRGEGGFFCAGAHRDELADALPDPVSERSYDRIGSIYRAFQRVGELKVLTVAAVRGGAVGAGMNLAFAADVRVAAEDAVFNAGFLRLGLHPGGGHFLLMARAGGREAAAAMSILGQPIDGRRARELGLVWEAVPDSEVEERARALAAPAAGDPSLTRQSVRSLRTIVGPPALPWPAALELERAAQMWSMRRRADRSASGDRER